MSENIDGKDHRISAVIIGAGVTGICALHRLVSLGIDVTVLEAGDDVGGTWYWNRYPGCRFDSESYTYGYFFSKELLQEWSWSEEFAARPETERYLQHVVDRFDLRRHIRFRKRVTSAVYNDDERCWTVATSDGDALTATFLITAMGILSVPTKPNLKGMERFTGPAFHTFNWPEGLDVRGKRVGVVGTGSTGVQLVAEIADYVSELKVFQRRPNWCVPLNNRAIDEERQDRIKASYPEILDRCQASPGGFLYSPDGRKMTDLNPEERRAFWEDLYGKQGFAIWLSNFREVLTDDDANAEFSNFLADKIRKRVHDPAVAEALIPKDHGFGTRRVVMEIGYFEKYNLPHVELVDISKTPITTMTESGLETTDGSFDLDVVVFATGFDAITGAFDRLEIRGPGGAKLADKWCDNPATYLGVQTAGFPNLFMLGGPVGGSTVTNWPRGIEDVVDWLGDLLVHVRDRDFTRVEATDVAEKRWMEHAQEAQKRIMFDQKWWMAGYNSNIEGRDRPRLLTYAGGTPRYRRWLSQVRDEGYEGFKIS